MPALSQYAPEELLAAASKGDKVACELLVEKNRGLVWAIVKRYLPRAPAHGADGEDLFQLGCIGLIKAVHGFDPEQGTAFSTYAVPKIAGEIRRFLRDDGMVKVSRSVKETGVSVAAARDALGKKLGREPRLSELSEETGIPPEDIAAADTALAPVESLSAGADGERELEDTLGCESYEADLLDKLSLEGAMALLGEREKAVVSMRFFRGMTQQRCAAVLGVSQVQVSRLEAKALKRLREVLEK